LNNQGIEGGLENHQYAKTAPNTTTTTITTKAIFNQDLLGFGTTSRGLGAASGEPKTTHQTYYILSKQKTCVSPKKVRRLTFLKLGLKVIC